MPLDRQQPQAPNNFRRSSSLGDFVSNIAPADVGIGPMELLNPRPEVEREPERGSELARGVRRGVVQMRGFAQGLGAVATGLAGLDETSSELAQQHLATIERTAEPDLAPRVGRIEDIESFGDVLSYVAGITGENVPNVATTIASGGISGLVTRLVAQRVLTRRMGQELAQRAAATAGARAAIAGATGSSVGLGIGHAAAEQIGRAGELQSPETAAVAGTGVGLVNVLLPVALMSRLGMADTPLARKFADKLFGRLQDAGLLRRAARMAAGGAVVEGLTETLQEEILTAARSTLDEDLDYFGDDANLNRLNALAAGAIVGGVFGGAGGLVSRRPAAEPTPPDEPLALPSPDEPITPAPTPVEAAPITTESPGIATPIVADISQDTGPVPQDTSPVPITPSPAISPLVDPIDDLPLAPVPLAQMPAPTPEGIISWVAQPVSEITSDVQVGEQVTPLWEQPKQIIDELDLRIERRINEILDTHREGLTPQDRASLVEILTDTKVLPEDQSTLQDILGRMSEEGRRAIAQQIAGNVDYRALKHYREALRRWNPRALRSEKNMSMLALSLRRLKDDGFPAPRESTDLQRADWAVVNQAVAQAAEEGLTIRDLIESFPPLSGTFGPNVDQAISRHSVAPRLVDEVAAPSPAQIEAGDPGELPATPQPVNQEARVDTTIPQQELVAEGLLDLPPIVQVSDEARPLPARFDQLLKFVRDKEQQLAQAAARPTAESLPVGALDATPDRPRTVEEFMRLTVHGRDRLPTSVAQGAGSVMTNQGQILDEKRPYRWDEHEPGTVFIATSPVYHSDRHGAVDFSDPQYQQKLRAYKGNISAAARQIERWMQEFAPDIKIIIQVSDFQQRPNGFASVSGAGPNTYVIGFTLPSNVPPTKKLRLRLKAQTQMVIAHEFGHIAIDRLLNQSSPEVQTAVFKAYREWVRRNYDEGMYLHASELLKSVLHSAMVTHTNILGQTPLQDGTLDSKTNVKYIFKPVEYIAQQAQRYLTNREALNETSTLIERPFYGRVARFIKDFFNKFGKRLLPHQQFADFMDMVRGQARLERIIANYYDTNGRPIPFLEHPPIRDIPLQDTISFGVRSPWVFSRKSFMSAGDTVRLTPHEQIPRMQIEYAHDATALRGRGNQITTPPLHPLETVAALRAHKSNEARVPAQYKHVWRRVEQGDFVVYVNPKFEYLPDNSYASGQDTHGYMEAAAEFVGTLTNNDSIIEFALQEDPASGDNRRRNEIRSNFMKDKDNQFLGTFAAVTQLLKVNRHIQGVNLYQEALYSWNAFRLGMIDRANTRVKEWEMLGKEQGQRLGDFLLELTERHQSWPTEAEIVALMQKHKLNDEAAAMYQRIRDDFAKTLNDMEQSVIGDIRSKVSDPTIQQQQVAKAQRDFQQMRKRPYFPLKRFGRYTIVIRAMQDGTYEGRAVKAGQIVRVESFETETAAKQRAAQVFKDHPEGQYTIRESMIPEEMFAYRGVPPQLLNRIRDQLNLSDQQLAALDVLAAESVPSASFRHHFRNRLGTAGYSMDAMRAYASYFFHGANHIARVRHHTDFQRAFDSISNSIRDARTVHGINDRKRIQLLDYLKRHQDYIYGAQNEWASLRSIGFHWYLGFMVKSAFINLTQVPTASFSHLAALYGDRTALNYLARAYKDTRKNLTRDWQDLPEHVQIARALGHEQGFLDESQATELAAVSEGSVLSRVLPGTASERFIKHAGYYSSWLFHQAERVNRAVTFDASYRLAIDNPQSENMRNIKADMAGAIDRIVTHTDGRLTRDQAAAFLAARDAVTVTQGEYARWDRPVFTRGKKSVIFLFKLFVQRMLWLAGAEKGGGRFVGIMLALGGLSGAPFAQDAMALARAMADLVGEDFDPEREARKFAVDLGLNPDLVMHGASRYGFGMPMVAEMMGIPFPNVDMSGTMSFGRTIPGATALPHLFGTGGDFDRAMTQLSSEGGGAMAAAVLGFARAIGDDNPNQLKRWERAMPAFMRSVSRATRFATQGREETRSGDIIARFDLEDPNHWGEIAAQSMGFVPTRVAQNWRQVIAQREAARFFLTRRQMLLDKVDFARRMGDREGMAQTRRAIQRFNREAPRELAITSQSIKLSRDNRELRRQRLAAGIAADPRLTRIYRETAQYFPTSEDSRR